MAMLSETQLQTLHAAIDRIIPADDFPGGWQAGVGDYLMRQFQRDLQPLLDMYRSGLDALDHEAIITAGRRFVELDGSAQDGLLQQVEAGSVMTPWPVDPLIFFDHLVTHAMEGYYGDPHNGGNHDTLAWKMIGFEVRG